MAVFVGSRIFWEGPVQAESDLPQQVRYSAYWTTENGF
jgi:hypothetical protein